jgi:hypothetical protein
VFTAKKAPLISELAVEMSQAKPGSGLYLAAYHKARKTLEEKLTKEERHMYKAMAKKWTENKLPRKMQQQYVHRSSSSKLG